MASSPNTLLTGDEIASFHIAERLGALRHSPEFNRIMVVIQSLVNTAREAVEQNRQPHLTHELALRWQERKFMLDYINNYIDLVVSKRREKVRELFESVGLDAETIDRNLDASLDFLIPKGNGHANPAESGNASDAL